MIQFFSDPSATQKGGELLARDRVEAPTRKADIQLLDHVQRLPRAVTLHNLAAREEIQNGNSLRWRKLIILRNLYLVEEWSRRGGQDTSVIGDIITTP